MEPSDLVRILKGVPETQLRLIKLAWELTGEDGSIDANKVALHYKEIGEASDEAQGYAEGTKEAVQCLKSLARSSP